MSLSLFLQDHQFQVPKDENEKSDSTEVPKYCKYLSGLNDARKIIAGIEIERLLENVPEHSFIVWDINQASHALVHCSGDRLKELENESLASVQHQQVILCITTQRPGYPLTNSNRLVEKEDKGRVILYARRVDALTDGEVTRAFFSMPYSQARAAARGRFNGLNQSLRLLLQGRTVKLLTSLKILCYGYLELAETTNADRNKVDEARKQMGFIEPRSLRDEWQIAPEDWRMLKAKVSKLSWWLTPFSSFYNSGSDMNSFDFTGFTNDLSDEWEMAGGRNAGLECIKKLIGLLKTSLTTANILENPADDSIARIVADAYISIEEL